MRSCVLWGWVGLFSALILLGSACRSDANEDTGSEDTGSEDAGSADAGSADTGFHDAPPPNDSGVPEPDAGPADSSCVGFPPPAPRSPPCVEIEKPEPTETRTVCPSGCDYSSFEDAQRDARPGWLFRVTAGTYSGVEWAAEGGVGQEIVVEPFGGTVTFVGTTSIRGNHLIFDGGANQDIHFKGDWDGGAYNGINAITIYGDYVTLRGTVVEGPTGNCFETDNAGLAIGSPSTFTEFFVPEHTRVFNSRFTDLDHKGIYVHGALHSELRNNLFEDVLGAALQINPRDGHFVRDLLVSGNAFVGNGACPEFGDAVILVSGLFRGPNPPEGPEPTIQTLLIANNLLWGNDARGIRIGSRFLRSDDGVRAARIYNNTAFNNTAEGISAYDSSNSDDEISIRGNLSWNNGADDYRVHPNVSVEFEGNVGVLYSDNSIPSDQHPVAEDPRFVSVDEGPGFLQPQSESPARGLAPNLSSEGVTQDFYGQHRPLTEGFDSGAIESASP